MVFLTFDQALSEATKFGPSHVLLGNGFSIACRPNIFVYGKLFEQADFSKLSPSAKKAFESLGTQDFERVIKTLRDAKVLLSCYEGVSEAVLSKLKNDADGLRELLVQTIANSHPSWPGEISDSEYQACRAFISKFKTVYTFNYDLLLYWAQMHTEGGVSPNSDDGFRKPESNFDAAYVTWESSQSHEQNTWFLHGALHVFDTGTEIQKYTWINTGVRLVDQIRGAMERGFFPLFVSEGTSSEKLARIRHSDYLAKAYRSFSEIRGTLFIYGHSLAENDEHYLKRIEKGRVSRLYVALWGDQSSDANKRIVRRARNMTNARTRANPLEVKFFDASTARVWGK